MSEQIKTILKRNWKTEDIHYWTNPKDGVENASVLFDGKLSRLRAGIIIIKGNQILLGEEKDEPGVYSLPGGSVNKGESIVHAAKREAEEETYITPINVEETGIDYCEVCDEVKDWVKENVPKEEWWYNYYTCLCIGEYGKEFDGKVDKEDKDPSMEKSARFYNIEDVINEESFKYAWKLALYNYGYLDDEPKEINESMQLKDFKLGTAGFILDDGTFLYADEEEDYYHGGFDRETTSKLYPEFSNTHPEEDTCIRIFKNPNEIQYKKLEEIIDLYLDNEEYCKLEIWKNGKPLFYKIYSLREGACEDSSSWNEQVGNWTGYKLIQYIKNYFNWESKKESLKEGLIHNPRILNYIDECIDVMRNIGFEVNGETYLFDFDDIEYQELNGTSVFGYMDMKRINGETKFILELNKYMFEEPEKSIKNTIYHELCHYVQDKIALDQGYYYWQDGRWCVNTRLPGLNDFKAHGKVWQYIADVVGRVTFQKITRLDTYDKHTGVGKEADARTKYIVKCKRCGTVFKYQKETNFIKDVLKGNGHTDRYWCCCSDGGRGHDFEIIKGK